MQSSSSRLPPASLGAEEEGEIREPYEVEKAPPSLPSVSGPSVDRHSSSTNRHSSPRAPSHHRRTSEKRRRSESREPQLDPRSFKPRFEPSIQMRRPRVSYADIDQGDVRTAFVERERDWERDRDRDEDRNRGKRSRTRSATPPTRAPPRGRPRRTYDDRKGETRDVRDRKDNRSGYHVGTTGGRHDGRRMSRERSLDGRGARPVHHDHDKRDAEVPNRDSDSERFSAPGIHRIIVNGSSRNNDNGQIDDMLVEIEEPIDEDKLIEERRKKREALKAKFRGQTTPMLATALGVVHLSNKSPDGSLGGSANDSVVTTPGETKTPGTPASPIQEASPGASFNITKDVNGSIEPTVIEEPSAADYDPTVDMQEDRDRKEQRRHEVSSSAYNEVASIDREVLMPDVEEPTAVQPGKQSISASTDDDDFDMFAEGDDDDMFAPEPSNTKKKALDATIAKAVPILEAKQLDAGMLDNWDDEEGYYKIIPGELLDGRYRVQVGLGKGMFSNVVRAFDLTTNQEVAIKVIRNNETMRKAGMKEIDILHKIREADPEDKRHIVKLERYFEHKSHLCIVFENLSLNLREVLKKSGIRDVGISLRAVRAYAHQLFLGLSLLRKCQILHADLKPDNVLVTESQTTLKICDLGSASDVTENEITPYLVSRFYRAPEIILGIPYDYAIDMWSIGCTLYELYTGKILFTGRTNNQMLRSIMECRGKFSVKLLKKGAFSALHFDDMGNFRSLEKDKVTGKDILRTINFAKPTRELKQRLLSAASGSETEVKDLMLFVDLLEKCLNLNPEKRCTPNEALKHPFIYRPIGVVGK